MEEIINIWRGKGGKCVFFIKYSRFRAIIFGSYDFIRTFAPVRQ